MDCSWTNAQAFLGYQLRQWISIQANDWTDVQAEIDNALVHGSNPWIGRPISDAVHAAAVWCIVYLVEYWKFELQRFDIFIPAALKQLTLDFNYTFAHSLDDASGLQI